MESTNELQLAKENAYSIQPRNPDYSELKIIGTVTEGPKEYTYYKDKEGNYWYDSVIVGLEKYYNSDKKCECWKCELSKTCNYRDKYNRLPRNRYPGALGLCKKL